MIRKLVAFFGVVKSFLKKVFKRSFKPIILAVLVFSLIVGFGEKSPLLANQSAEQTAASLIADGKLLLERGRAEEAFEIWKKAEEIYQKIDSEEGIKGIIGSQLNQGLALEAMGFYRRSCNLVLTAFSLEEKCEDLDLEKLDKVINAIAANSEPFNWMGLQSLGNRLRLLGELEKSEIVLEAVLKIAPEKALIYLHLGNTVRDLARLEKARKGENLEFYINKAVGYYNEADLANSQLIGLQARLNRLSLLKDFEAGELRKIDLQIRDLFANNEIPSRDLVYALVNYAVTVKEIDKNKAIALLEEAINQAEKLQNYIWFIQVN